MGVKLVIKKAAVKAKVDSLSELQQMIDEAGVLQEQAAVIEKTIKLEQERLKPYKDAVKRIHDRLAEMDLDPDLPINDEGSIFRLEGGTVGTTRTIADLEKIREMLGDELFLQLATVKLGDLDKYLTPPQLDQVLETKRTTRSIKLIRRAA